MAKKEALEVGARWAYRLGVFDNLTEVEIRGLSEGPPARVTVLRRSGELEGTVHEVPPSRLKAPWSKRDAYLEEASKWRRLTSHPEEIESEAVESIFREFIWPAALVNGKKSRTGTVTIFDADLVDVFIGGGLDEITAGTEFILDETGEHYGWSVAIEIARRLCAVKAERVMAFVHAEEAQRSQLASGKELWCSNGSPSKVVVPAASEAAFYEEVTRPMCDLIRSWCGEATAQMTDELQKLRAETSRFAAFFAGAIAMLVDTGGETTAWAMYRIAYPDARRSEWRTGINAEALRRRAWRNNVLATTTDPVT